MRRGGTRRSGPGPSNACRNAASSNPAGPSAATRRSGSAAAARSASSRRRRERAARARRDSAGPGPASSPRSRRSRASAVTASDAAARGSTASSVRLAAGSASMAAVTAARTGSSCSPSRTVTRRITLASRTWPSSIRPARATIATRSGPPRIQAISYVVSRSDTWPPSAESSPHSWDARRPAGDASGGDAVQLDPEPGAVGGQHLDVVAALTLVALVPSRTDGRADEGASAQGHPARLGERRADEGAGEVRLRRAAVPPAPGLEVTERAGPRLQAILRRAVLEHVEVALGRLGDPEDAAWIVLVITLVEPQRVVRVTAEADVGAPRPGPYGEVVVRHAAPVAGERAGGRQLDLEAERRQQRREGAAQLVAEPAAAPVDDLGDQRLGLQDDVLAEVDAQVLEGHRAQMTQVQVAQRVRVGPCWARGFDSVEVGVRPGVVFVFF